MHMNDAAVINILVFRSSGSSLGGELLNSVLESAEPRASINKRDLGNNDEGQNGDEDFASHIGAPTWLAVSRQRACARLFFEIDLGHGLNDLAAKLYNLYVFRMDRISVQHGTIAKPRAQSDVK